MQTLIEAEEKPLGVIESLQQGFNFLNRHLWLLLPLIILDIGLWLGPRLSIAPLIQGVESLLADQPEMPADVAANFNTAIDTLQAFGSGYNLLSLLAGLLTGIPSLMARLDIHAIGSPISPVILLSDWHTVLLLVASLIPLGVLIGSYWLTLIAFSLEGKRIRSAAFLRRWGWVWLNVNLYLLALLFILAFFSVMFGVIGAFALVFGAAGALFIAVLWIFFIGFSIWLSISLYFVVISVAMDGVNLARAVWRSLNVVGRNAVSTLGFFILAQMLMEGFARIWARLSVHEWGVALSILGNAYLGAAIVTAAFLFYQSRYQHWRRTRAMIMLNQSDEHA